MPIGLAYPIRNGKFGYFDQTNDTNSMYKTNLINLLNTRQGERRFNPSFGCRLWNFSFEQNDELLPVKLENSIREDVSTWINGITVNSVTVQTKIAEGNVNPVDIYMLYITIVFTITSINQTDSINLILDTNIT